MIQSTQKIIKIGSSGGVTIPAKELKRNNISFGDEVEITVRKAQSASQEDVDVIRAARKILQDYEEDFKNLAKR